MASLAIASGLAPQPTDTDRYEVIRSRNRAMDGAPSSYRWGVERKAALLQRECPAA